jgi:branched-chain amino acid aminotransferase/4-amino-4-deoxychorismate lyase
MIPDDDRGLLLGDGLFETLLAEDGELRDAEAHVERMIRGCAVLGLEPPDAAAALAMARDALADARLSYERAAVRLTLTAGSGRGLERPEGSTPRLLATASPAPAPAGPARLVTVSVRRNDTSPAARVKALSYLDNILARAEARAAGADEAVMLNTQGEIACAAAANLFWISDGWVYTPALECGVLDGIVRGKAIAAAVALGAEVFEDRCEPEVLYQADAVFLTSSLAGVREVSQLDGRALEPHALVQAISSRCR